MVLGNFSKVVFSGDILRVEDREENRFRNSQSVNIDWLHALFGDMVGSCFPNAKIERLYGDEGKEKSVRWTVFDSLQLPLETSSWAAVYRDKEIVPSLVCEALGETYRDSLWITFEAPPYLMSALEKLGATYIDFSIHPIRFLPDYFFGVRSNNPELAAKLKDIALPDEVPFDFARMSKARTVRVMRRNVPQDSIIFLGQMGTDSSLIVDGRMADIDDVTAALRQLTIMHDVVYYKAHPHFTNVDELKRVVEGIPKCQWLDINVYDALGYDRFGYFATLSSGTHVEAKYFNKSSKRFLKTPNLFDGSCEEGYTPIYAAYLDRKFWKYLFEGTSFDHTAFFPDAVELALRTTLNQKWGR